MAVNGVWAEIPVLLSATPECYTLPSVLVVIIQVANIGVLLYAVVKYCFHHCKLYAYKTHLEIGTILLLIVTGVLSCALLALFWDRTLTVFGKVHSVSFFILSFFLALVDCTSSVLFIPFMKHFPAEYLSALYIGEGLSGLVPSLFAFSQGYVNNSISCERSYIGHEALGIRFSPSVHFMFLGGMMLLSGAAFIALITLPAVRKHMVNGTWQQHEDKHNIQRERPCRKKCLQQDASDVLFSDKGETPIPSKPIGIADLWRIVRLDAALYICLSILSFLSSGAVSAVSSFAFCLYDNSIYHISVNLALISNPVMSFFFFVFPSKSKVISVFTTVIICVLGIYVLVMAQQPAPAFQRSTFAMVIMVSTS